MQINLNNHRSTKAAFFKAVREKNEYVACIQYANLRNGRPIDLIKYATYCKYTILNAQVIIILTSSLIHCSSAHYDHSVFVNFIFQNKITTFIFQ